MLLQEKTHELSTLNEQLEFIMGATKTNTDIIDADLNLIYVDRQWQSIYGNPKGRKCYEYFMGRKQICPTCGIPKALKTKKIAVTEEILPRENNRVVEVHTIPFKEADGSWKVAEFNIDITERKRAEQELLETNEKLKTLYQRLETIREEEKKNIVIEKSALYATTNEDDDDGGENINGQEDMEDMEDMDNTRALMEELQEIVGRFLAKRPVEDLPRAAARALRALRRRQDRAAARQSRGRTGRGRRARGQRLLAAQGGLVRQLPDGVLRDLVPHPLGERLAQQAVHELVHQVVELVHSCVSHGSPHWG
jgi:PAS domain-containing protein